MKNFIIDKLSGDNEYTYEEVIIFLKYYNLPSIICKRILKYKFPERDIKYPGVYIRKIIEEFGDKRYGSSEALKMINAAFKSLNSKPVKKKDLDIPLCDIDTSLIYDAKKVYKKKDIEAYIKDNRVISVQALVEMDDFKKLNISAVNLRGLIIDLKVLGFISNKERLKSCEIFYKDINKVKRIIMEQKG